MPNNENISDIENRCTVLNHVASRNAGSGIRDIFARVIRHQRKFCLWNPKPWNLESGIPLTIGIQNLSFTNKDWNSVPGIRNPRREVQNSRLSWIFLHGKNSWTR